MITRGRGKSAIRSCTLWMKCLSMYSVMSKSLITPSFNGRMATMFWGVRPSIRLASAPTARIAPLLVSLATTDGSLITMPRPRTWTSVLAVPRSIPTSREMSPQRDSNKLNAPFPDGAMVGLRIGPISDALTRSVATDVRMATAPGC